MNYTIKCAATAILLSVATIQTEAQDLARRIPSNALAVVTVKGDQLTQLMSVEEFNRTFMGVALIDKLSNKNKGGMNSLDQFGLDPKATYYYYNQSNDSVTYNCLLAPVKSAAQIDEAYKLHGKKFEQNGELRSHYSKDSTGITLWNEKMVLFVLATGNSKYFSRPEVRERLGLLAPDFSAPSYADAVADSSVVVTDVDTVAYGAPAEAADIVVVEADSAPQIVIDQPKPKKSAVKSKTKYKKKKSTKKRSGKKPKKKAVVVVPEEDYAVDSTMVATDSGYDSYTPDSSLYKHDDKIKNALAGKWAYAMATASFNKQPDSSILDNKDFVKSVDHKAEMTVWISGAEDLMNAYVPQSIFKGVNFLKGYGSATAKLYLEDKSIRLSTALTVSNEVAGVFNKLNKRKLNKKFLNYINEDKMIGYMAYAMDSKAYLEEYPKLISKMYGIVLNDEINMATDLFSLLLDEEAVSKVLKGDAIFVFNGLSQKEVTYTANEYDEDNFETKEVTKTKQETLPDFLFMTSSEDTRLFDKLITYGIKKNVVIGHEKYFELKMPKSPMTVFFAIKDGIIFFGSDAAEMEQIVNNRYTAKVSSRHKKIIGGNNYASYFSAKKLAGKIPVDALAGKEKMDKTNKVLSGMGDIYLKSLPAKGNTFAGEVSMEIPANQKNALKYIMSLLENLDSKKAEQQ